MIFENIQAIVLAAGKSTRLKTGTSKLLEKICGQEMILYTTSLLERMNIPVTLVVGFQKEQIEQIVRAHAPLATFVVQEEQKGTGHALMCTQSTWTKDHILIMNGDMPLVSEDIIQELCLTHLQSNADISFVTSHIDEVNHGYGRVIKTDVIEIVEAKNFVGDPHQHTCINAGIYIAKKSFLQNSIAQLHENKKTHEFYITDLVKIASDNGGIVMTTAVPFDHVRGINNFQELWAAEQVKRAEMIKEFMDEGVRFISAQTVHIDVGVTIGAGSTIGIGVNLQKGTTIGKRVTIEDHVSIANSIVGDNSIIHASCVITDSAIGANCQVGPFAHMRMHTQVHDECLVGNFVEMKESNFGAQSKAKHLSYLGNATIGSNVNIGAGTITCNHDGITKHATIIEDNAYVGSNNTLVAPVTIGANAFTAAGSTITNSVPADALAIARMRQINKEGYAKRLRSPEKSNPALDNLRFAGAVKTESDNNSDIL